MEENIITIANKRINCSRLSDEKLLKLYEELERRERIIDRKIAEYQMTHPELKDIDINEYMNNL